MPTMPRLLSGLCLALLGYVVSEMIKPLLPESTAFGIFSLLNAGIGFLCGWKIVGSRAGDGMSSGIGIGITGAGALVAIGLFVQSCNEMVKLAMRHRYDGPFEALAAIFEIAVEYGTLMATAGIITTLIVGGILTGVFAEYAAKRWK